MKADSPQNCLTFNLQRAARSAGRHLEAALKPVGLTAQQFTAMAQLAGHGSVETSRLAERMGADRTTVTRNIQVLRERGIVELSETADKRVVALRLSDTGKQLYEEALPRWQAAQNASIARLGDGNLADFLKQLSAF